MLDDKDGDMSVKQIETNTAVVGGGEFLRLSRKLFQQSQVNFSFVRLRAFLRSEKKFEKSFFEN